MKLIKALTWSTAFTAGLFFAGLVHANAQQPAPDRSQAPQQDQSKSRDHEAEPASITGQLMRVDPSAKTFSVKSASGAEMLFRYDDRTVITGAESNVAGLATSNGSEVTVSYRNDSAGNMASKVEVHAKR